MDSVVFSHVSKAYGGRAVLRDISLAVKSGEFVTVIGRSGCGKTTLLKLVNRLIDPDSGIVTVNGADLKETDAVMLRRSIGYAIQNVGLFPHMTIADNIAYVPSISSLEGWRKGEREEKIRSLLSTVGLDGDIMDRYPRSLSGGQRQRVGIARALAADPSILLMDEPFGAVDEITREQLQEQMLKIHREKGITVLFVTHDIAEALKLGTKTLILNDGSIEQYSAPSCIIDNPATPFIRELIEKSRVFSPRQ